MNELKDFEPLQLRTLLSQETVSYYKLIGFGASVEECTQCNDRIKQIQQELASRRDPEERNILDRQYVDAEPEYYL
jgi:hypothetical protein